MPRETEGLPLPFLRSLEAGLPSLWAVPGSSQDTAPHSLVKWLERSSISQRTRKPDSVPSLHQIYLPLRSFVTWWI